MHRNRFSRLIAPIVAVFAWVSLSTMIAICEVTSADIIAQPLSGATTFYANDEPVIANDEPVLGNPVLNDGAPTPAVSPPTSLAQDDSLEPTTFSQEAPDQIVSDQEAMPIDAFGYLGGLLEARFYEPHSTTGNPHDEIREAASLYGLDLPMMMSIAKVESNFNPRARTGSYKGLFQLSDYEFEKYGDGSIWDARDNARAAAHMLLVQAEKFRSALGHYPDYAERYMVHQQGIQGAIEHYTHPERVAWQSMCATDEGVLKGEQWCRKCIWRNLLPQWKQTFKKVEKISSGDFVKLWTGRIDHLANRFSVAEGGVVPTPRPNTHVSDDALILPHRANRSPSQDAQ